MKYIIGSLLSLKSLILCPFLFVFRLLLLSNISSSLDIFSVLSLIDFDIIFVTQNVFTPHKNDFEYALVWGQTMSIKSMSPCHAAYNTDTTVILTCLLGSLAVVYCQAQYVVEIVYREPHCNRLT